MKYSVVLESKAEKQLRKADSRIFPRLRQALISLAEDSRPPGCVKLSGTDPAGYRVRVGSYRIIYGIDDVSHTVRVLAIGPRSKIYRDFS